MDIHSYLSEKKRVVDAALVKLLAGDRIPDRLKEAMLYSVEAGGKRLRPLLVIAGAEAVGGHAEDVMNIACAIEMIHTFSLIHDDLPSMDDDNLRRGRPTNHKVFGESTAILAGDALLAEAFYVLGRGTGKKGPGVLVEIISDIAKATGGRGMTGGQQIDMESSGSKLTEEKLNNLHAMKTGCLIKASVTSGAKFCGATVKQVDALEKYGALLGLAFQIADDVLDIEGNQDEIGKDVGSDVDNDKATYPSIIGLEASKKRARELTEEAIKTLLVFDDRAAPLREIAKFVIERRK